MKLSKRAIDEGGNVGVYEFLQIKDMKFYCLYFILKVTDLHQSRRLISTEVNIQAKDLKFMLE